MPSITVLVTPLHVSAFWLAGNKWEARAERFSEDSKMRAGKKQSITRPLATSDDGIVEADLQLPGCEFVRDLLMFCCGK